MSERNESEQDLHVNEPADDRGRVLRYEDLIDDHFIHRASFRVRRTTTDTEVVVEVEVTDEITNGLGGLQGGMVATLVDVAAGVVVRNALGPDATFATQDLSIHYLAALRVGPARALARVRKVGRRSGVVQVDVVDGGADDRLCAVATATFTVVSASGPDEGVHTDGAST